MQSGHPYQAHVDEEYGDFATSDLAYNEHSMFPCLGWHMGRMEQVAGLGLANLRIEFKPCFLPRACAPDTHSCAPTTYVAMH